jgi:hypothetical protein
LKDILFTNHAIDQIKRRGLKSETIEEIIINPQQKFMDTENPKRMIYQSVVIDQTNKEKIIRVVIEESEKYILVITSYKSSNIKKYWRK